MEISSDGSPEFVAAETKAFFKKWGVHQVLLSYLPSLNERAKLAVNKGPTDGQPQLQWEP